LSSRPRIFVSIASYRDPECQHTVRDLFEKAAHSERISVGICAQLDPELDRDCTLMPPPRSDQVREIRVPASESKGGCWARAQAISLLQDEDYVLQIDAHMRFVADWDEIMLDTLKRCPSRKSVLSTMPPGYRPPHKLQDCSGGLPITVVKKLAGPEDLQPVSLEGWIRSRDQLREKGPLLSPFIIGNFLFAPSTAFREVPVDPHIYFRGQEATFSVRLWTHGWDVYQPDCLVIYHYWGSKSRGAATGDYKSVSDSALVARARVWHVLGLEEATNPAALIDIEKYSVGTARPLKDFWEFAGVDLRTGTIAKKAATGYWTPYRPSVIQGYSMQRRERDT
jgi:hypothetical protein